MNGFDAAQRAYDNMMPEEYPTCPKCDSENFTQQKYSSECEDCGYSDEADFDGILEAKAEARMEHYND